MTVTHVSPDPLYDGWENIRHVAPLLNGWNNPSKRRGWTRAKLAVGKGRDVLLCAGPLARDLGGFSARVAFRIKRGNSIVGECSWPLPGPFATLEAAQNAAWSATSRFNIKEGPRRAMDATYIVPI